MGAKDFTDLRVWQEASRLADEVYAGTADYPQDEKYGMALQMRRAAASVPANIAEGFNRRSPRDRARFYEIAKSSAEELRSHLLVARTLRLPGFPPHVDRRLDVLCRMLYRLRECVLSDLK